MTIISNHEKPNHRAVVTRLLKGADEASISVAFLKQSGLKSLIASLPKHCTCYIGTDYHLTEPAALRQLLKRGVKVYLPRQPGATFHPKVYYIRKGNKVSILAGSANLTGGGLEMNLELSVLLEAKRGSEPDKEMRAAILHYASKSTELIGEAQLSQYERRFESYWEKRRKADKEFKAEQAGQNTVDLENLSYYFRQYWKAEGEDGIRKRRKRYRGIRGLLDELLSDRIDSAKAFLAHYEAIAKKFYSSDLLRGKGKFSAGYRQINRAIRYIRDHRRADPRTVYGP